MTQKFADDGKVIPVTVVLAGPCFITQLKTEEKDGYKAIQLGFGSAKKVSKPVRGHLKNLGPFKYLREFSVDVKNNLKVGQEIKVNIFEPNENISVTGISKGKGFQGVVKRWGFAGSPASHGHKDQLRMPGSIGATGEARVKKGKKMPGHMGANRVTIKNLKIVEVDEKNNLLFIKGAIPGRRNSLVLISSPGEIKIVEQARTESPKTEKTEKVQTPAKDKAAEKKEEKSVEEESPAADKKQKTQKTQKETEHTEN